MAPSAAMPFWRRWGASASFSLTNQAPSNLVVTSLLDDVGNASNCTPQAAPGKGADAACSLRDALLEASSLGSANVTFDATVFASPHTIQLVNTSGSLAIPANTTITGATSGSGAGLTNLVTVSGGGRAGGYPVFQVSSGVTAIANLTITNGYSVVSGGGIAQNGGTLTITEGGRRTTLERPAGTRARSRRTTRSASAPSPRRPSTWRRIFPQA